jgi:hypothetical protein
LDSTTDAQTIVDPKDAAAMSRFEMRNSPRLMRWRANFPPLFAFCG